MGNSFGKKCNYEEIGKKELHGKQFAFFHNFSLLLNKKNYSSAK